jgi:hypothetical protein
MDSEEALFSYRMSICDKCPLKDTSSGVPVCSNKIYVDKNTGQISKIPTATNVCGCGCVLSIKGYLKEAKCPLEKW